MPSRATIESRIADVLDRSDLTSQVTIWFDRAHRAIQRFRDLKFMEDTATITAVSKAASYALPANTKRSGSLYLFDTANSKVVEFYNETSIATLRLRRVLAEDESFDQNLFAVWKDTIELEPPTPETITDREFRLDRWQWVAAPASGGTDFLTENAEEWLVYRALRESAPFLGADQRLVVWKGIEDAALREILGPDVAADSGGELVMRG